MLAQPGAAAADDDAGAASLLDALASALAELDAAADELDSLAELDDEAAAGAEEADEDDAVDFFLLPHAPRLTRSSAATATDVFRQAEVLWLFPPSSTVVPS